MRLPLEAVLVAVALSADVEAFVAPLASLGSSTTTVGANRGAPPSTPILFAAPATGQHDGREGATTNDCKGPPTSVGDVVRNLHGGKYQFSDTQYLAGGSVTGRQFAESLYAGDDGSESIAQADEEDGELPRWAVRLQNWEEQQFKPLVGTLTFDERNRERVISVTNDERSWEKYYAFVVPNDDDCECSCFRVSPTRGTLAPRGGASNACATKPYLDTATISIEWVGGEAGAGDAVSFNKDDWLLVVGTEAEVWRYHLTINERR